MTDFDLDRLGDVWREQLDPKEIEALKRTAAAVSRRARWAELFDLLAAIVVSAVVLTLVALNPRADTVLIGVMVILVLLGSHVRQRKLRRLEIKSLTGTAEEMLDQSIERVRARIKANRSGLIGIGPAVLLGLVFASVIDKGSDGELLPKVAAGTTTSIILYAVASLAVGLAALHLLRSYRNCHRELDRLTTLREAYRREREPSDAE